MSDESTVLEHNTASQTIASPGKQSPVTRIGKALLVAFLIVMGVFFGVVVAIFIGLSTGWIEFRC
jgi:hypothetical protein